MSFWQIIKTALIAPSKLGDSIHAKGWKVFLYLLLLSLIACLPIIHSTSQTMNELRQDAHKISQSLPTFAVKDGKLNTKNKGYIYETSHLVFTFDPNNKRSNDEIKHDLNAEQVGLALQKNQVVLAMPNNALVQSSGLTNPLSTTYANLGMNSFNQKQFKQLLDNNPFVAPFMTIMAIISFLSAIVSLLFNLLIITFAATFYSKLSLMPLKFGQNFKICLFASTWATIISAALQWFNPASALAGLTMLITLLIYFAAVQQYRKPRMPQ